MTVITRKVVPIDGIDYEIQAFAATKGIRIFQKLAKLIGPAFQALSDAKDEEAASAAAISALFESMDEVAVDELMKELMANVTKEKVALNFDIEFMANYGLLVKLAQEVVMLNWGSLFSVLGTPEE